MADTTASQAKKGKDIQGIPWERLSITREKYRQTRLEQYKNYENIPQSGEGAKKVIYILFCFITPFTPSFPTITKYNMENLGMQNHEERGIVL